MAEMQPGDKLCDRCGRYLARKYDYGRLDVKSDASHIVVVSPDLCAGCVKIVDSAIKRAVKPK